MSEEKYQAKIQPRKVIVCPHCGYQYLPAEVLYPDNVIGKPDHDVVRDPLGHILYEHYQDVNQPLAEEHYICDECGKPFVIEVETTFKTKPEEEALDFADLETNLW